MNIQLSKKERDEFIAAARAEFVSSTIESCREDLDCISIAQACGLLNISVNTLKKIKGLTRYEIEPRKIVLYKRSEILAALEKTGVVQ